MKPIYILGALIILSLALVGCSGGTDTPTTGHVTGYIYAESAIGSEQAEPTMFLLSAPTYDPALQPLAGVTVGIIELGLSIKTDHYGAYGFYHLAPGDYLLRAVHPAHGVREWEIAIRAGYTTFGKNVLRRNVAEWHDDSHDYHWDDDHWGWDDGDNRDDRDDNYVPPPPSGDDTPGEDGGISLADTDE